MGTLNLSNIVTKETLSAVQGMIPRKSDVPTKISDLENDRALSEADARSLVDQLFESAD